MLRNAFLVSSFSAWELWGVCGVSHFLSSPTAPCKIPSLTYGAYVKGYRPGAHTVSHGTEVGVLTFDYGKPVFNALFLPAFRWSTRARGISEKLPQEA